MNQLKDRAITALLVIVFLITCIAVGVVIFLLSNKDRVVFAVTHPSVIDSVMNQYVEGTKQLDSSFTKKQAQQLQGVQPVDQLKQ